MTTSKSFKIILLSLSVIALSLTFVSCNKDNKSTEATQVEENTTQTTTNNKSVATAVTTIPEPSTSATSTTKPVNKITNTTSEQEENIVSEISTDKLKQLDLKSLGFSIKDDYLYYNQNLLSVEKIINYTIESDKAIINNTDSSTIMINDLGDLEVVFPVGIKLLAKSQLSSFELYYGNYKFTIPTLVSISKSNDWYKMTLDDNIFISFDEKTIDINVDNLMVEMNNMTYDNTTKLNDVVLTKSRIVDFNINAPTIQLTYEDGSILTHTIGGDTTFNQENNLTTLDAESKSTFETANKPSESESTNIATSDIEVDQPEVIENNESKSTEPLVNDLSDEFIESDDITDPNFIEGDTNLNFEDQNNDNFNFNGFGELEQLVAKPNHIGVSGNYSFLAGDFNSDTQYSPLGARLDLLFEKEVSTKLSIALELGFGANHFDNGGFYKVFTPMFSLDYNFKELNTKGIIPYVTVGVGSMISLLEENFDDTYFRMKAGAGLKFNISETWLLKTGINYNINITSGSNKLQGIEVPICLMLKF